MSTEMRFGVIGAGDEVLQAYQALGTAEGASAITVTVASAGARRDLGAMITVPIVETVEELCANPDVEAVYITLPTGPREDAARLALAAGKHVLLPEPWDAPLDQTLALCALADEFDVSLALAAPWAVDGRHVGARMLTQAGLLGELIGWRAEVQQPDTGQDPLPLALPALALVGWLAELEAEQVFAQQASIGADLGLVAVVVRYATGCVGSLQTGSGLPGGAGRVPQGLRVQGSAGQLDLTDEPMVYRMQSTEDAPAHTWRSVRAVGPKGDLAQAVARFVSQIEAGEEPPLPVRALLEPLRILDAARRSLSTGAPAPVER